MLYGQELINKLEDEIRLMKEAQSVRADHIDNCDFDWDDCFISARVDERGISNNTAKIKLIKDGGCAWFREYATLDGHIVDSRWCKTRYGLSLRVEMPDGSVVWTTATTQKGLAKKGLKAVLCKRPAWYTFRSSFGGMLGVYAGDYVLFPSDVNYSTGEDASIDPIEIIDVEE